MPIRDVADDRDVRAPRLPSASQLSSVHTLRRTVSVICLIAVDTGSLLLAAVLVTGLTGMGWAGFWPGFELQDLLVGCAVVVITATASNLYGRRYARHSARLIGKAWAIALLVTLALMLLSDPTEIGARYVLTWIVAAVLSVCCRYAFDGVISLRYGPDGDAPPVLLLGTFDECRATLPTLRALAPRDRVNVVGLVVTGPAPAREAASTPAPPVVASHEELADALAASGATQLVLVNAAALNGQLGSVMETCRSSGVALKLASLDVQYCVGAISYVPGMDCPLYVVRPSPAGKGSYLVKAAVDRVASALGLALLSPLLLTVAILIKLTSRGPAFFVDERVGVGQRTFRLYKFRTMAADARAAQDSLEQMNEAGGVLFKIREDPRVTGVGRILRRFSIDELPQLANVLKGDMSLVGPRPLPLRDYQLMAEADRRRHVMLPGITGLWQVSGRSSLSFEEMVRLDEQYMESWSLKTDLHIMWRTIVVVFHPRGAY